VLFAFEPEAETGAPPSVGDRYFARVITPPLRQLPGAHDAGQGRVSLRSRECRFGAWAVNGRISPRANSLKIAAETENVSSHITPVVATHCLTLRQRD
jgi:hypothetical protein